MIITLVLGGLVLSASLYFNYRLYSQLTTLEEYLFLKEAVREANLTIQRGINKASNVKRKPGRPRKTEIIVTPAKKRGRPRKTETNNKKK